MFIRFYHKLICLGLTVAELDGVGLGRNDLCLNIFISLYF